VEHADQQGGVERLARERGPGRRHLDRLAAVAEQPRSHGPVALADDQATGAAGHEGLQQAADGRRQLARLEVDERARRRVRHVDGLPTNAVSTTLVLRDQCETLPLLIGTGELEPEMRSSGRMQLLEELVSCKGASRCPMR
jgi:hypothetical protein